MRRPLTDICVIAALILAGCGDKTSVASAPEAPALATKTDTPPADTRPIVVMLGDSLTAGYQLAANEALPAAIQRDLDTAGVKAKIVNAGVSGDTTADGLNRFDFSVTALHPALVVIALGANDFLDSFPPETPRKNLAAILDKAKTDNIPAALLGVSLPKGAGAADNREAEYAAIYPSLAKEYGVPYYPDMLGAIAGKPQLIQKDGVHPTAEGVEAMASAISGFIAPLVPRSE